MGDSYNIEAFLTAAGMVLLVAVVFAAFILWDRRRTRLYLLARIREQWGKEPDREYDAAEFANISHYYLNKEYDGFQVDDITWNDLDMDHVFCQMNHTRSFIGESYLYYRLRTPQLSGGELEEFEQMVEWFGANRQKREEMEYFFAKIGQSHNRYSVFDYIYHLQDATTAGSNLTHYACILLILFSIAVLLVYPQPGILLLLAAIGVSCYIYDKRKKWVRPYITSCVVLDQVLQAAENFVKQDIEWMPKEQMKEAVRAFAGIRRRMFFLVAGEGGNGSLEQMVFTYLNMFFHLDLIQFRSAVRSFSGHIKELEYLIDQMGRMEAAIAVASFRVLHPNYAVPVLHEEGSIRFAAVNMYHPLITNPVANSVDAQASLLLTGSNASGKSTFLKTAALQALLAQTIHTVTADSYEARYFRIYSSMALRDDLVGEESYYMVEIRSLKRILDRVDGESNAQETFTPILCCIDEVLRGTNTVERISASSQILKWMAGKQMLCFAATHDIELTYILEGIYRNYHFEEQVTDEEVTFDYQLREGRAMTRNAIRLLHLMGFEDEIIAEAEAMAARMTEQSVDGVLQSSRK
ncbi:MAG: hypothetical protein LUD18_12230 [Lachnospiraceae bacterium]|nr:hypothetical protein [Lachnospiraceae bacterium]